LLGREVGGEGVVELGWVDCELDGRLPTVSCRIVEGTSAVFRTLSLEPLSTSPRRSPSSGAKAATKTRPTTLSASVAAFEITAPPYEWPTVRTGPGICSMKDAM